MKNRTLIYLLTLLIAVIAMSPSALVFAYSPPPATNILGLVPILRVTLPPALIYSPTKLYWSENGQTLSVGIPGDIAVGNNHYHVTKSTVGAGDASYDVISVFGFRSRNTLPYPKDFKLNFDQSAASLVNIKKIKAHLNTGDLAIPRAFLSSNVNCSDTNNSSGLFMCMEITAELRALNIDSANSSKTWNEVIPLTGVAIQGNVLGQTLNNFFLDPGAIAVGNSISIGIVNEKVSIAKTTLAWGSSLDQKFTDIYNSAKSQGKTISNPAAAINATSWNLYSPTDITAPVTGNTTFSSPPEGTIWYLDQGFNNGNAKAVHGSGVVVVNGSVNLSNAFYQCDANTRFALIVKGDITFKSQPFACGVYIALGDGTAAHPGNIDLTALADASATLNTILVARNNVILPNVNTMKSVLTITYDKTFAQNPTVLLKDIWPTFANLTH